MRYLYYRAALLLMAVALLALFSAATHVVARGAMAYPSAMAATR